MGEGACQHDILWRPSCGPILTYETIFVSIGGPQPQLHPEVLNTFLMYGKVYDQKILSTFLRSSWERGRVNMIFYGNLTVDLY